MADKETSIFHKAALVFIGETVDNMTQAELVEDRIHVEKSECDGTCVGQTMRFEPTSVDFKAIDELLTPAYSKRICPIVVETKPIINKPKNLKYPNGRRKKRIWKKWAKRFGYAIPPQRIEIPKAEIESRMDISNGKFAVKLTATAFKASEL